MGELPKSSCCGARSHLPGDSTVTPGSGSSKIDPAVDGIRGASLEGCGQRELDSSATGRSLLLGWQMIAASSSLPVPALHIRDWGQRELPSPMHGPKLQTIPRTVFPGQNKGLEPARNPLRNRILLGNTSPQQVWTEPWPGKGEIRFSQGSWELCQEISGYPESCGRPESPPGEQLSQRHGPAQRKSA